ncbi:MAG: DedA family protein [Chloroflexota bacterium]|nr:DedA family protein [Chloroflexota bacterium]
MHIVLDLVATYGYVVVLLVVLSESAGLPLPGETSLLVAAAIAATGKLWLPGVILAAAAGAILGDTAGYWIGRTSGLRLIRRHGRLFRFDERKLAQAQAFFEKHGEKTVFLGRFIPVGRIFSALLAGVGEMRYSRFLLWNAAGGVTWATLMGVVGYLFGRQLPLVERLVGQFGFGLLAALIVAVVARFAWSRRADIAAWWAGVWAHPSLTRLRARLATLATTGAATLRTAPQRLGIRYRWLLAGAILALAGVTALLLT